MLMKGEEMDILTSLGLMLQLRDLPLFPPPKVCSCQTLFGNKEEKKRGKSSFSSSARDSFLFGGRRHD